MGGLGLGEGIGEGSRWRRAERGHVWGAGAVWGRCKAPEQVRMLPGHVRLLSM